MFRIGDKVVVNENVGDYVWNGVCGKRGVIIRIDRSFAGFLLYYVKFVEPVDGTAVDTFWVKKEDLELVSRMKQHIEQNYKI